MVGLILCALGLGCVIFLTYKINRDIDKPSKKEILLEEQNDLLRRIDNTLVGIDTRLIEIQEKNSGG